MHTHASMCTRKEHKRMNTFSHTFLLTFPPHFHSLSILLSLHLSQSLSHSLTLSLTLYSFALALSLYFLSQSPLSNSLHHSTAVTSPAPNQGAQSSTPTMSYYDLQRSKRTISFALDTIFSTPTIPPSRRHRPHIYGVYQATYFSDDDNRQW